MRRISEGKREGFTLVELLTVMAILSILYAMAVPAFIATKAAVVSTLASNSVKQLGEAAALYCGDADDTAPLAMYNTPAGLMTWFGMQTGPTTFDPKSGILSPYTHAKPQHDPTFDGQPWKGDGSGFGYNWGYIGSDFNTLPSYPDFPNCRNAAQMSQLSNPSNTIVFATSSYFAAPWLGGNGQTYDFGFIDPPRLWAGNPDMDFRHQGTKTVNPVTKTVTSTGHALVVRADGSAKSKFQKSIDDSQFTR